MSNPNETRPESTRPESMSVTSERRAAGWCPREFDDPAVRVERELERLSEALGEKFEEVRLIHDLTDRLGLDQDVSELGGELMLSLRRCVRVDTLAMELVADPGSGFAGYSDQVGERIELCELRELTESAWREGTRALGDRPIPGDRAATVAVINRSSERSLQGRRVIVVPIRRRSETLGHLVAVRSEREPEFGTAEVDLFRSVLMILAVHLINQRQFRDLQRTFEGTVRSLVAALDAKDVYTGGHSFRVADLAAALAIRLGYDETETQRIRMAGTLHDIGKIGVEDAVLLKPGGLSEMEFDKIKRHPLLGYEILKDIPGFRDILPAVRHHHESWDGRGYPDGLRGETIPRDAQILGVADAFDAMVSDRPYRQGMPLERVIEILRNGRGEQWAADVVDALIECDDLLEEYSRRDGGTAGVGDRDG